MRIETLDPDKLNEFLVRVYVEHFDYYKANTAFYDELPEKYRSFAVRLGECTERKKVLFEPPMNDFNLFRIAVCMHPRISPNRYNGGYTRSGIKEHVVFLEAVGSGLTTILEVSWHDYYRVDESFQHDIFDLQDNTWLKKRPEFASITSCVVQAAKDSDLLLATRMFTSQPADARLPERIAWHEPMRQFRDYLFLGCTD